LRLDRRKFLQAAVAGASGAMLARRGLAAPPVRSTDPFQLVPLGTTDLRVSLIGAGTGMRGHNRSSNQTRMGAEKFESLLRYAYDKGIRLFDLADIYGSHPYLARALADKPREDYVLISKVWVRPGGLPEEERPDADVVVDRFRQELGTDYIDLVQIHCMTDEDWTDNQRRQMDILEDLKQRGVIRAHGVSIHSLPALKQSASDPWVDVVHTRINPYGDSMDDKDPAVVTPVISSIHEAGKGVIGMKLIGEGRYREDPAKRDEAIRYVLGLGTVDTMIVGFEKPEEIDDFATRVESALEEAAAAEADK
jgi:aryl-alcohol dehydrogenase-like predicted oxidoreductase